MRKLLQLLLLLLTTTAQAQTNNYTQLDSFSTALSENRVAIALGGVPGYSRVAVLGHNPSIGVGAAADVWEGGGNYPFLVEASLLEVVSTSANDTAAGTGARTVTIVCLDSSYNQLAAETITLNGLTPVVSVSSCLRTNLFATVTSGSNRVNVGDITLRAVGGGAIQGLIRAGYGFSRSAVYTVPNGFTLFATSFVFTILNPNGAVVNTATFGFWQQSSLLNVRIALEFQVTSSQPYYHTAYWGLPITQRTDFIIRVTSAGQAGTNVTAALEGVLVNNAQLRR
jgi:hypothetical protein